MANIKIVVLTNGFIYVGEVAIFEKTVRITKASNIRYWSREGTGLGSRALSGPQKGDIIDKCGDLMVSRECLHHTINCDGSKW
jgi:hypothetical protein